MSYARLPEPQSTHAPIPRYPFQSHPRQQPSQDINMRNVFVRSQSNGQSARRGSGGDRQRTRKLALSYSVDWIVTIVLAAAFFALDKISGFKREFSLDDTSYVLLGASRILSLTVSMHRLRHPFAVHERVPNWALIIISVVSPIVLMWVINLVTIRSWWDAHNSTLGAVVGLALTGAITQFTKVTVGRPRPDVISRCNPAPDAVDPPFGLSSIDICHTLLTQSELQDGFRSFPSGHSSLSFAGLGFLSFYLAGKMHLFDKRGHAPKAWLALAPLAGAALVAISRTMDYRHHWQDVLVGTVLGLVVSYFSYRQYYPSLGSELSHRPYSPRIKRMEPLLPTHHHTPSSAPLHGPPTVETQPYTDQSSDEHLEDVPMHGTVRREEPGPLRQVWKEGDSEDEQPTGRM
ncbi:phosphatidic acid phosphatase type 2/haloperoxidase [Amylostereum chailletii]|nr:phosphatidic acid phosphatase type 2/haloperoxidase [Amylostereum chailletii]